MDLTTRIASLAAAATALYAAFSAHSAAPAEIAAPTARLSGNKAWVHLWVRECQFEPDWITVPAGTPVHFAVTSEDIGHIVSIRLCRDCRKSLLDIHVPAGRSADGECTFPTPGEYCIYCTAHETQALSARILVV